MPGLDQAGARRGAECPAECLRFLRRYARGVEDKMRNDHAADQDRRQGERIARAMPCQIDRAGQRAAREQLLDRGRIRKQAEIGEMQMAIRDDADAAQYDQACGGAEKAADDGIGNVADRAPDPRQADAAKNEAGDDRRARQRHQHRCEQRRGWVRRHDVLDQRRRQDSGHRRGGCFRRADSEWKRTADGNDDCDDRGGGECRRDAIGQIDRQRAGENQNGVGQTERDGQDAGCAGRQDVSQPDGAFIDEKTRRALNGWANHAAMSWLE